MQRKEVLSVECELSLDLENCLPNLLTWKPFRHIMDISWPSVLSNDALGLPHPFFTLWQWPHSSGRINFCLVHISSSHPGTPPYRSRRSRSHNIYRDEVVVKPSLRAPDSDLDDVVKVRQTSLGYFRRLSGRDRRGNYSVERWFQYFTESLVYVTAMV